MLKHMTNGEVDGLSDMVTQMQLKYEAEGKVYLNPQLTFSMWFCLTVNTLLIVLNLLVSLF